MLCLLLGIILGALIFYKIFKSSKYWEEKDVVHAPSWPVIGSLGSVVMRKKHMTDVIADIYKQNPNERYVGYMQFTAPFLLLRDLELIKQIGVKDFDHFHDHLAFTDIKSDPLLAKSLISLSGEEWRQMRATLSPAFTSSKMKNMYHLIAECAENFANHFRGKQQVTVEAKNIFCKFANDVIATTAFGIKIDTLKEPNNEFFTMGNGFTKFTVVQSLKMFLLQLAPRVGNLLKIQLFTEEVSTFFRSLVKDNMTTRDCQRIIRPDLIHLLMEARKGKLKYEDAEKDNREGFAVVEESHIGRNTKQMQLTDDLIVSQALTFFFAGFDTVSTAASFMAYELAVNPDVQKKLQNEIDAVNYDHHGKIPYEVLLSMKYLDQVVCETLRLWPPAFQTDRLCVKNYAIQPTKPEENVLFLEKGSSVLIPIMTIHRDPQYYDEPERFDPERFSDENKSKIVSGSYLPFGIGPRNCIGSRFALLEIKTLFFHLLSKLDIVPVNATEIPMKISPKVLNLAPENGFKLGFKARNLRR